MSNETPKAATTPRLIPAGRVARGRVVVPPSKSVSHRYLNLALLAEEPLHLERPLLADDTRLFLAALRAVGFSTDFASEQGAVDLEPHARPSGEIPIFCGNAGTMARFLVATLAAIPGRFRLDGTPRLRERPVGPLVEAVRALGGELHYLGVEGFLPLGIRGGTLEGGRVILDAGSSSQYLSALLMAGTRARGPIEIEVAALASAPYIDVTLALAREFGASIKRLDPNGDARGSMAFRVEPGLASPRRARVEGDWSAAAYPAAAAALTGGVVRLAEVSGKSAQGDRRFIDLLVEMGAEAAWCDGELEVAGDGKLRGITADLSDIPDQVPTLAALAPFARGETTIENVPHLRIKESDRLAAMARGLEAVGAPVTELPAGLVIPGAWADGVPTLPPALVDPWDDHRIAMSFALLGLRRPGVSIGDPAVVGKSYPEFWRDFSALIDE